MAEFEARGNPRYIENEVIASEESLNRASRTSKIQSR
jgi:hypothetical protein